MSIFSTEKPKESVFQNNIIQQLIANGWKLGNPEEYNRELALYPEDLIGFIKDTQEKEWEKFCQLYPTNPEQKLLERVATQLNKVDPNAADKEMRTFGTLGVLRNEIRDRGVRFRLCQFKPDHDLNPDILACYQKNRFTVVPELVYSASIPFELMSEPDAKPTRWRIDLVLFVNGLPIATLELKSEFNQSVQKAIQQYKTTRLPKDPSTHQNEPLLTFKRGALVHFAVSQYEVYMTTHLQGADTYFLPFNKGTSEGGAGNDIPQDPNQYATDYLWNEILLPDNLLTILARYIHLKIEDDKDWDGRIYKKESLIFPRYHQWKVVNKLLNAAIAEGPGHRYLIQHSAGSGKSNSIAWVAHQLSSLRHQNGVKNFDSVIIVTDRTVLDDQLQDTIYQFEQVHGTVVCINKKRGGTGSKSEKLANALASSAAIIVVTIQTFPHVLKAIENNVSLKNRCYAIIADEAHSSQTGSTARHLKKVLATDSEDDQEITSEDALNAILSARRISPNVSYFAFTATPKPKTLEFFGRVANPVELPSEDNKPVPFDVYSMRQAIEEGFILDVLQNYTSYKVAYNLALKMQNADKEVDVRKAKVKLNQWVRLHEHNISQKVKVIVEHFKTHVINLLAGRAKAMIATSSRKEAVRYKLALDKYIAKNHYQAMQILVAFSGEVQFYSSDPTALELIGNKFTETNMNPGVKPQNIPVTFDSDAYQMMVVANKFQTGFDQPKLCAMYVDKKLGGLDCVQTLSRLNRTYKGKTASNIYVLDFVNEPEEVLTEFKRYYQTAELADVSNPNLIFDLFGRLRAMGIFTWEQVEQFAKAFFEQTQGNAAIANICKPAVEEWKMRYQSASKRYSNAKDRFERAKKTQDAVLMANAENDMNASGQEKNALEIFKKDLGTFVRYYEFMSQIVDYNDTSLEKLSLYARYLGPMLRENSLQEDDIDLSNVELSHYRLSKTREQSLALKEDAGTNEYKLSSIHNVGTARARNTTEVFLSQVISRLNDLFVPDHLTENDMVNYAYTIRDKVRENKLVMKQLANNEPEQAIVGDFKKAIDDAIMDSNDAHQKLMTQLISDPTKFAGFAKIVFDMLKLTNPLPSSQPQRQN